MVQYSPLFVIINALIFAMWAVTFCRTLTRRFSMPVTILGFALQFLVWLIPPYFMGNGSILRAVYPLFGIVLPLFLLFRDRWNRILFVALGCLVFMYIADLVPCAIIFTPEQMRKGIALQPLPQRLVAYAICVSLDAFLLWMLVLFMNRYKNRLHGSECVLYLLFPFSQYLLLFGWLRVCLSEMTFPRAGYVIAAMLVCMAADVALYIAVRGMAQRSELKVRNDILSAQIDRQKEHYAAITAQYETIRRMRHDIAKHLYTMQALLHAERYQDAAAYLSEVSAQTQVQERLGVCENPIVDAYNYLQLFFYPPVFAISPIFVSHSHALHHFRNVVCETPSSAPARREPILPCFQQSSTSGNSAGTGSGSRPKRTPCAFAAAMPSACRW